MNDLKLFEIASQRREEIEKAAFVGAALKGGKALAKGMGKAFKKMPGKTKGGKALNTAGAAGGAYELSAAAARGSKNAVKNKKLYKGMAQKSKNSRTF